MRVSWVGPWRTGRRCIKRTFGPVRAARSRRNRRKRCGHRPRRPRARAGGVTAGPRQTVAALSGNRKIVTATSFAGRNRRQGPCHDGERPWPLASSRRVAVGVANRCTDQQDGHGRITNHRFRDRPEDHATDPAAAVGGHGDERASTSRAVSTMCRAGVRPARRDRARDGRDRCPIPRSTGQARVGEDRALRRGMRTRLPSMRTRRPRPLPGLPADTSKDNLQKGGAVRRPAFNAAELHAANECRTRAS